jgi:hypothetical protein
MPNRSAFCEVSPVALSRTSIVTSIGAISSVILPAFCAAAVRCCDSSEYSSCASRGTL